MKCALCNKDLDMFNVDLGDGVKVHVTCFFDDSIPNAPSKTDKNFDKLKTVRENAINARVEEIRKLSK